MLPNQFVPSCFSLLPGFSVSPAVKLGNVLSPQQAASIIPSPVCLGTSLIPIHTDMKQAMIEARKPAKVKVRTDEATGQAVQKEQVGG